MTPSTPSKPTLEAKAWRSGPERNELLNSPHADWARKLRSRRLLVVGYLATTLGMAAAIGLIRSRVFFVVLLLGLVTVVFLIGSLNTATRGVIDLKAQHIDERQRQERGVVYERSYRIAVVGAVVVLAAAAIAALTDHLPTSGVAWVGLAYAGFATLSMLPTLVAAWSRTD